jgi:hypothetical protein
MKRVSGPWNFNPFPSAILKTGWYRSGEIANAEAEIDGSRLNPERKRCAPSWTRSSLHIIDRRTASDISPLRSHWPKPLTWWPSIAPLATAQPVWHILQFRLHQLRHPDHLQMRVHRSIDQSHILEQTITRLFDGGIVHALTIILQLRRDIACLIFFSGDAIWQRFYNSFMKYLLIITRNKLIVTRSIICEPLSLFAAVSLTLWLNIRDPWHECNRTPYGLDSGVHGIRFTRDWWG